MRAYRLDSFVGPKGLRRVDAAEPTPGPGEALVRLQARSLNYRDALILENRYAVQATAGVVPVSDGAGVVTAIGPGVSRVQPGDRVAATYFPQWLAGAFSLKLATEQFGCTRDGALADLLVAPAAALVHVPEHLSFEEAATLPCAGVTAWAALTEPRAPVPSHTVLTIGTGGVALFALQFAKLLGARVIAITSSRQKRSLLLGHGADVVIESSASTDWERDVRQATGGAGVDFVVETGSIETLPKSLAACASGAHVALVAALGDGVLAGRALSAPVTIRRSYVGSRADFEAMNRAIAQHEMRPVIDRVFEFDDAEAAYAYFVERRHGGNVVISG